MWKSTPQVRRENDGSISVRIAGAPPLRVRGCLGFAWSIFVLIVVFYAAQAISRTPGQASPLIFAHRGGPKYASENTLAAFSNALDQGADGIEFDVQMSRDGALVVIHDETVDRTTNGTGAVRDLTLAQLESLDAGNGEHIPTFEQVVGLAKARGATILPEAKSAHLYPGLEARMLASLQAANYVDHTIVEAFERDSLDRFRRLDPDLRICALYGTWQFDVTAPAGQAQYICPEAEMVLLFPGMILEAHTDGRRVIVWFLALENPFMIRTMRYFGADGFIANDPPAALTALGR